MHYTILNAECTILKTENGYYYWVEPYTVPDKTNMNIYGIKYKIQKLKMVHNRSEVLPIYDVKNKESRTVNVYKFEIDNTFKCKRLFYQSYMSDYRRGAAYAYDLGSLEDVEYYEHVQSDVDLKYDFCNIRSDNLDNTTFVINNYKNFYRIIKSSKNRDQNTENNLENI